MNQRERNGNELRKKIQNYSYGLNDHMDLGHKGNIFKGVNEQTEERVAIKVVDLRSREPDFDKEHLSLEIDALKKLKHINIIHCLDIYSTVNNCYIITQFCDQGDLENKLKNRVSFKEPEANSIFRDIVRGYWHLSKEKYVHGNLKPSCLLIKENVIKISGFSNCRKVGGKQVKKDKEIKFNPYQSPESVKQSIFNSKSDMWSLGMLLYVMLHGNFPWQFNNKQQFLQKVGKPYIISKELSEDVKEFLKKTLINKENRLNNEDLLSHPYIQRINNNYFGDEKYLLGVIGQEVIQQQKNKKDNMQHTLNKVQKQINCQINWMRFLFRLTERLSLYPEDNNNTILLKLIIIRQIAAQYQSLKRSFNQGENDFGFNHWKDFCGQKERMMKYKQTIKKYDVRYEKVLISYKKLGVLLEKINLNGITNDNFILSEYNCMVGIKASIEQIRKLWFRIIKEYPAKSKYDRQTPFRFKSELLLLDFIITYYQLNCLLIDDFHRIDYFEKMSKLEITLDCPPADLDLTNLIDFQNKLTQLTLIP